MQRIRLLFGLALILTIFACSSVKVSQDYNLGESLPTMQTYRWQTDVQAKSGDVRVDNPLLNERIRRATDRVLGQKGFQKTATGTPDFRVAYAFSISQKVRSDDVRTGVGFGVGTYGRHGGIAVGTGGHVTTYDEALLVIDLVDARGDLLWRGKGTRYLPAHAGPEKTEEIYSELVEKILEQFPPEGK